MSEVNSWGLEVLGICGLFVVLACNTFPAWKDFRYRDSAKFWSLEQGELLVL